MGGLLIVDGSNLLFQMFYGMPARIIGKNGKPIQGTLGFIGALGKILKMVKPTHIAVLFDGECHNERKDLDRNYKANRPDYSQMPEEDTPFGQMPDIFRALTLLRIPYAETSCCEADDWIAGYCKKYGNTMQVTVVSQDSDFFQLISDRVSILRYRGQNSVLCDRKYIQQKLGIEPEQYGDFKSLVGDTADNIRGADKVGPKTASLLLRQFGSLASLFDHIEEVEKPSIRASLLNNAERLRRNQRLIVLSGSADLPFSLEDMTYHPDSCSTTQLLQALDLR